jgi:uncharacterized RDD family membrane protein YckC
VTSYAAIVDPPSNLGATSPIAHAARPARLASDGARVHGQGQRVLRVRAAVFPRRMAASIVDLLLVTVVSMAVTVVAALALGVRLPGSKEFGADFVMAGLLDRNPMVLGALGLFFGISGLYQIYLGGMLGQTPGKRLLRLRVISSRGQVPGPVVASVRFLAMLLSLAPAGLGWLWCIFDRERRALHDHLSGTYVIFDADEP